MDFVSRIRVRYLALTISAFIFFLHAQVLAKRSAPDISDVLQGSRGGFDLGIAVVGFFALSLATLSVAKGYELFTKIKDNRGKEGRSAEMDILKEENDRLLGLNSTMQYENEVLRKDLARLESAVADGAVQKDTAKKNELGLRKEIEKLLAEKARLAAEKDSLALKASQSSIFEVNNRAIPRTAKKKRTATKKLIKARAKKGVKR